MTSPADLIVGGAAGLPTRLGVGGPGQVLTVVGGVLTWAAPSGGGGAPSGPAGGDLAGTYPNPQIATGVVTDSHVAAANKDGLAAVASLRTLGTGAQQAAAGNDARLTNARTPTAHATTHQPGGADAMAVDAVAATGSLRTLGTGATQAAPGNDARFTDSRPPTGTAGGDLSGSYPNPQIAAGVVTDADVATANKDGVAGTASMRTLGAGATQAAAGNHAHAGMVTNPMTAAADLIVGGASGTPTRLGVGSNTQVLTVVGGVLTWATPASGGMTNPMTGVGDVIVGGTSGTPTRLAAGGTNGHVLTLAGIGTPAWQAPASVAPLAHATTHQPGGADPLAVDAAAGTGSLRTLGTGAVQAAAGSHTHAAAAPAAHATTHQPGGADPMAVDAAAATGSLRTLGTGAQQAAAGNDGRFTDARPPTGTAGGDLTGSYPNPQIAPGVITDADVATANKDGLAATASLRTLGTGAQQAAAGNDSRLTNARTPTAHATTHQPGGSDAMAVDAAAATGSLRTLGTSATSAAAGNDARLTDTRVPTAHATTHQPGGADAMAVDAVAATGSLRTLGTGATQAAAGDHAHAAYVTNPMTAVADLIVGGTAGAPTRLGVGSATQVLTVVGGALAWATPASGGMTNPMTTPGDIITGGVAGAAGRLGVGAADQVLGVAAGAPAWVAAPALANLLTNPGLECWQRGAGPFTGNLTYAADRWYIGLGSGSALSASRDSANADAGSQYCLAAVYTHAVVSRVLQAVEQYAQLRGSTVTLAIRVKTSTAGAVRVAVYDSVNGFRYSAYHTGGGAYETLAVTAPVAASATGVQVGVDLGVSCTAYADNAVLVVGSSAPAYAPLHPAVDLTACQRYYWELGGTLTGEPVLVMQAYATTTAFGVLTFPTEMAIPPTLTVSAPGDWSVFSANGTSIACTAVSAAVGATRKQCRIDATVASGLVAGNATMMKANATLAARLKFEANPP